MIVKNNDDNIHVTIHFISGKFTKSIMDSDTFAHFVETIIDPVEDMFRFAISDNATVFIFKNAISHIEVVSKDSQGD